MKNLTFITLLLLLSTIVAKAQEVKKAQPDSIIRVIPVGDPRHSSYLYTIGDKLRTSDEVAVKLMAYAPSAAEFHAAKSNATWVYVSFAGAAVSGLGAVIEFANNSKYAGATTGVVNGQASFIYQHHSLTGAYVFTGIATAFLVSSIVNLSRVAFHSHKALQLYNQRFE
jgi:hypothetical protein